MIFVDDQTPTDVDERWQQNVSVTQRLPFGLEYAFLNKQVYLYL